MPRKHKNPNLQRQVDILKKKFATEKQINEMHLKTLETLKIELANLSARLVTEEEYGAYLAKKLCRNDWEIYQRYRR